MTPEQLEIVFDTLDVEQKGYLTLDQFLERFSEYTFYGYIITYKLRAPNQFYLMKQPVNIFSEFQDTLIYIISKTNKF